MSYRHRQTVGWLSRKDCTIFAGLRQVFPLEKLLETEADLAPGSAA
jgi:hypothetical protein